MFRSAALGSIRAATTLSQQEWTTLRNELMKQSHEVFDDVRNLLDVWIRHLEHPLENPEEVENKVTASLREILMPETWKLRLKVLQLPVNLPTIPSGSTPLGPRPPGAAISGTSSASASVGGTLGSSSSSTGSRPSVSNPNLLDIRPGGLSVNGAIKVEAPILAKLLGLLW